MGGAKKLIGATQGGVVGAGTVVMVTDNGRQIGVACDHAKPVPVCRRAGGGVGVGWGVGGAYSLRE